MGIRLVLKKKKKEQNQYKKRGNVEIPQKPAFQTDSQNGKSKAELSFLHKSATLSCSTSLANIVTELKTITEFRIWMRGDNKKIMKSKVAILARNTLH